MGLDSVELVLEIEKYFGIRIPDAEAEKTITVQNLVDCVSRHLDIRSDSTDLREQVLSAIIHSLSVLHPEADTPSPTDHISNFLPSENIEEWQRFEETFKLNTPTPALPGQPGSGFWSKVWRKAGWKPMYDWGAITVVDFADAVCAANYKSLLARTSLTSKYEVYIAVAGITAEKIGVDVLEISADKAFVKDLGID